MKRLVILIFALGLLVSACGSKTVDHISDTESEDTSLTPDESAASKPEISLPESSAEESEAESSAEESKPESQREPILPLIQNHSGLVGYGDLEKEEYSAVLADLEAKLASYDNTISFVVYSIDNSKAISYNTEARIFCASAIKAPFAYFACTVMEELDIPLSTETVYKKEHYETGTGDLQYQPVGSVFTLETVISKAMSISDNVGYNMTVDYFGRENYNLWAEDLGIESLTVAPTVWSLKASALDFAKAWGEMYKYFGTDSEYANFLYNSCTNTGSNFATQMLDKSYSHKQGHNRSGGWHSYTDAGIVWDGEESYIFAILSDIPGPNATGERMMEDIMTVIDELF
ncbi:MAG: serine hydrolase [Clostridia bacterium]|nr:serine hydrolase [Clostridia bacterium]